ncbi:phosphatase PAP2 family protein [Roseibium aggregatum]|uniref:phosphatase PAP2 family protein n=1 Tax=Roseibium aggregatum TaxID=187304 RepID=UPI001A8D8E6D|nr:phosphatase PAP2 family protein [Roseibium aggregatum]MBN8184250.1 phosphatase PAP2 family protein [Roseibium aggregatum]UES42658.1 hypothetical protein GFK90_02120 [Roseibium aggregatum]
MSSVMEIKADSEYKLRVAEQGGTPTAATSAFEEELAFPGRLNAFLMVLVIGATLCLYVFINPRIEPYSFVPYVLIISTCVLLKYYVMRRTSFGEIFRQRMQLLLNGVVFIFVALASLRIFNHLTMSLALPLADPLLDSWDKALGLDWMTYFTFVQNHSLVSTILEVAYVGFDGASLFGFVVLVAMGYFRRARYFCEIFLITAAISTTIALFFPAVAAVVYNFGPIDQIEGFNSAPGIYHLEQFMALREAEIPSIDLMTATGLATFPSFHAAGGVLLIAGFFRTRLSIAVTAFALVMIASVPVFGGHFLIDAIVGILLAATVSVLNARRSCYAGLFGKDPNRY